MWDRYSDEELDQFCEMLEAIARDARMYLMCRQIEPLLGQTETGSRLIESDQIASFKAVVYLLQGDGDFQNYYKIGMSIDPEKRLAKIVPKMPFTPRLIHTITSDCPHWLEDFLHEKYKAARTNGEWFNLTDEQIAWLMSITEWNKDEGANK